MDHIPDLKRLLAHLNSSTCVTLLFGYLFHVVLLFILPSFDDLKTCASGLSLPSLPLPEGGGGCKVQGNKCVGQRLEEGRTTFGLGARARWSTPCERDRNQNRECGCELRIFNSTMFPDANKAEVDDKN